MALKIDSELQTFAEAQRVRIVEKATNRQYPLLQLANGNIIPLVVDSSLAWLDQVEFIEFDVLGMCAIIGVSATDYPRIKRIGRKFKFNIRNIGSHVAYTYIEMKRAEKMKANLESSEAEDLRWSFDLYINQSGYFGDSDYNLPGLIRNSYLPIFRCPSTLSSASDGDAMAAILNAAIRQRSINSKGLSRLSKVVMPTYQMNLINETYRTGTEISVAESVKKSQENQGNKIEFVADDNLLGAGRNGEDVALLLPNDPDVLRYLIASDFDIPEDLSGWTDAEYKIFCTGQIVGVVTESPIESIVVENI